jgi:type VI secretion system protein ImpL
VFSFFRRRAFVLLIGFLLIAIFIWFAGPYFAFASYRPLETEFSRLIAISLVVGCWVISALLKRLRASRANGKLAAAVISQSHPAPDRPSGEATKLRERFEEAVATLTQQGRPGHSLYDLPWYVFIGAPGSGKTTALLNSGLRFPLEQRVGKAAVRGVGGTRNCDWWFTDEAVFLDTAGRYTTQDSDAASDSEGWREFLALLSKYRKRRPLNGIVLTISAQDLLMQGDAGREAHVEAVSHRLNEFTRELRVQLPVYVMVTKCDMVAGFTEYFDDLAQESRAQVWGVTFPYEQSINGEGPNAFPAEFDALMARLNGRLFARLEEERGARRRATIFAFPQQMAALRDPLTQFVSDIFSSTHAHGQILLRGVYLTSGTQDGTQIDRLLGSIGRRFGIAQEAVAPAVGRGKAFFVERLLKHVVIGESGLAGVNRRLELRKAAWQLGAYAAIVLVVATGLIVLSVSYASNRAYLAQVETDVETLRRLPPGAAGMSLQAVLPRLDAVRAVHDSANKYADGTPWSMRWGLYQGGSVGHAARDAYLRELDSLLLPRFAARVRQRLLGYGSEPEKLYVYLKAYLMLGDPRHLDKKDLQFLADLEWKMPDAVPGAGTSLAKHFQSLLELSDTLRPIALDAPLVAQARSTIRQASIAKIMYGRLQRSYSNDGARALRLDMAAGVGIEKVLRRKSGRRLSEPVPSLYTQQVFKEVTGLGMVPLVKQFAEEQWVWGTDGLSPAGWAKLTAQVTDLYERDYNVAWDALLSDLEIVGFSTVQQYADALGIVVGATSPLRGVLKVVVENTSLVAPPSDAASSTPGASPSVGTRITEGARDLFNAAQKKITGTASVSPGTVITQHFQPIHRLMAGAPAPIDGIIEQIRKIRDQLLKLGPQVGGANPLRALSDPVLFDLWRALRQDAASLPPPVNSLVTQIAQHAEESVGNEATTELERLYQQEVVARCRVRIDGRYPFGSASDIPLTDFGETFGHGGVYDKFFTDKLDKLVDRSKRPWAWRPESVEPSILMLDQFERAERIREMFFSPGSKMPELAFTVKLSNLDPAATRFYLNIDGYEFDVKPGAESRGPVMWPGKEKRSFAFAAFEDRVAAPDRIGLDGPWAWFRLIDAAKAQPEQAQPETDLISVLHIQTRYHRAVVTIEASNAINNPFAAHDWRQFKCGP